MVFKEESIMAVLWSVYSITEVLDCKIKLPTFFSFKKYSIQDIKPQAFFLIVLADEKSNKQ